MELYLNAKARLRSSRGGGGGKRPGVEDTRGPTLGASKDSTTVARTEDEAAQRASTKLADFVREVCPRPENTTPPRLEPPLQQQADVVELTMAREDGALALSACDVTAAYEAQLKALTDLKARHDATSEVLCTTVKAGLEIVSRGLDIIENINLQNQVATKTTADQIAQATLRLHDLHAHLAAPK